MKMQRNLFFWVGVFVLSGFLLTPAMATSWTAYYTLSTPSTPPGESGWAELISAGMVWVDPGNSIWIGAKNIYRANAVKTGTIRVGYQAGSDGSVFPAHLWAVEFAVGGQPGTHPASWDDPLKTYISSFGSFMWNPAGFYAGDVGAQMNFFPQPGWEWVRFENISSTQVLLEPVAFIETYSNFKPVPLPGVLLLLE
jgi:hypothetical protein